MSDRRLTTDLPLVVLAVVVLSVMVPLAGASGADADPGGPSPAQVNGQTTVTNEVSDVAIIIEFETDRARDSASFSGLDVTVTGGRNVEFMPVLFARAPAGAIENIERRADVRAVYRDSTVSVPNTTASPAGLNTQTAGQHLPWGVERIDAPAASEAVGASARESATVAVLDTGIDYTHGDLSTAVSWGANFTYGGRETGLTTAMDDNGHGTLVAGVISAADDDGGVVGVSPGTELYAIKVMNGDGDGAYSWVINGIDAALAGEDGDLGTADDADVLSLSLGGKEGASDLQNAIDGASDHAVVVSAAGNYGDGDTSTNNVTYPAKYAGSIAVAMTDDTDRTPLDSSEGEEVELAAPGVGVTTTQMNGGTTTVSGTSLAAPHVSGVAALVIADDLSDGQRDRSPTDVREDLQNATFDIESPGVDRTSGYGLLLADEAVGVESGTANFSLSALSPGDVTVDPGDSIDVSATVTNVGERSGTQTVALRLAGERIESRSVSLASDESTDVLFQDVPVDLDAGTYEYGIDTENDSRSAAVTVRSDARFEVSAFSPGDTSVVSGDPFDVTATIENTGDVEASQTVELRINGTIVETRSVTLAGGEATTVSFTGVSAAVPAGVYEYGVDTDDDTRRAQLTVLAPASFDVRSLDPTNASVTSGDSLSPTATIENTGNVEATQTVELRIGGAVEGAKTVTIGGGETMTVSFDSVPVDLAAGVYEYGVYTDDDSRTTPVTVRADAQFAVSALSPGDSSVVRGDAVDVMAVVENTGDVEGTRTVELRLDGTVVGDRTVTLPGGESEFVSFGNVSVDLSPGEYEYGVYTDEVGRSAKLSVLAPATFDVRAFDPTNASVTAGHPLAVTATIGNTGDVEGTSTVTYTFGTGVPSTTTSVELAPGNSTDVVFEVNTSRIEPGAYTHTVSTADDEVSGTITVSEVGPGDVTGDGEQASDLDGDGTYEDVNGDGQLTASDVQALFANRNGDTIRNNPDAFDFNGDGSFAISDVQALFAQLSTPSGDGPGDVTGDGEQASDLDGDGAYEDVNGDGQFTASDVQALFANQHSDAIRNNPASFDFNGDGSFTVSDVQALFARLS